MDVEAVAREFLVAVRGKRSQTALSRSLGYRSNVVYAWEAGRRWPTAAETLRAAQKAGHDVPAALRQFYGASPAWLEQLDPTTPEGVAMIMEDLRGSNAISLVARRAELSRYSISRWLGCKTQPRLPDFFRYVEASSLRLLDLLAAFVPPTSLPSVLDTWNKLEATRKGSRTIPWSPAILHGLELEDYRGLQAHRPGWLAHRLGISPIEEAQCLEVLTDLGIIRWNGTHYEQDPLAVDTRGDPVVSRKLKAHWTDVAAQRILRGEPGQYSYNVFTCSQMDFERIRELHLAYFRRVRSIVAASSKDEVVAVVNVQLFALTD